MSIAEGHQKNLNTLHDAMANGDVCLMECFNMRAGKSVVVLCIVNIYETEKGKEYEMLPFAEMYEGDQYDFLVPHSDPAFPDNLDK